jgi:hypothetical protein
MHSMVLPLIEKSLTGDSKEIRDIASNEPILIGFLTLAKEINELQSIDTRFYEESRSLYQVTAVEHPLGDLVTILSMFFGKPAKATGKKLPISLRFDPAVKHLGGLREDQVLFLKKLKTGTFYGTLWPWQREPEKIEIHLGFCSPSMSKVDYNKLGTLVNKFLSKKKIEALSGMRGQIDGINLPSFLQMSETEGATYTLKITSGDRSGYLYVDDGTLIAAEHGGQTGIQAASRIISWEDAAIQIEPAFVDREREIHEPLMHVMMESLKVRDETAAEPPPPPSDAPAPKTEAATAPPPAEPPGKGIPQTAPPKSPPAMPGGKAADRSTDKKVPTRRISKLLAGVGVVTILAVALVGGAMFLKHRQADRRYQQLVADLASTEALDAQIVMIMQYLKANPQDKHQASLEARLNKIHLEIEKQDYEKTLTDVEHLLIDEQYEKKARSLYVAFLSKYPQGRYAESVRKAMDEIRQTSGTDSFESLKTLPPDDWAGRYAAYHEYLSQFPRSAERETVEKMIADLIQAQYREIERSAAACDKKANWDDCLARCDRFLTTFGNIPTAHQVNVLREAMQDKKDAAALIIEVELAGDDYRRAKQVYTDYLASHPNTSQKDTILQRIDTLNADLAERTAWENTKAYATNPRNDIVDRVKRLETFIRNQPSGPYATAAKTLRNQLDQELQAAIRAQRKAEQRRQALARQQADHARREKEAQRMQQLRLQVSKQFRAVAKRFVDNGDGTVTDRYTGIIWSLLDSYLELGRCISYKAAKVYVQQLNIGNHSDWRLPTAGELATIYKNGPFFPGSGADWYWTSESFARGYHRVVDVVTSAPETVFTRVSKNEDDCGNVRAVRR